MKRKIAAGIVAGLLAMGMIAGCSQQPAEEPEATSSQAEVSEPTVEQEKVVTIGTKADDSMLLHAVNETGKEITEVYAKGSAEEGYPEAALPSSEAWADGVAADIYIPATAETAAPAEGADVDVALSALYDLSFVFADGTTAELFEVPDGDFEDLAVKLEGDVAYLEYKNAEGAVESTLQHQQSVLEAKQAEAEAAAQAAAQAEAEAVAQAQQAQEAQQATPVYTDSYSGSGDSGSAGSGGYDYSYDTTAPADDGSGAQGGTSGQTEDSCVSDIVLN